MSDETTRFYDWLAGRYNAVYADWEGSVRRQAAALDGVIRAALGAGPHRVLDCTCGIGTQALGLAELGYGVRGTDLSPASIDRARGEAARRGLAVRFDVADVRSLSLGSEPAFDVVLSADNALPHLTTAGALRAALDRMVLHARPGGLFLASIRDYDTLLADRPHGTSPTVTGAPGARRITFQTWSWPDDGDVYELELFVMQESGDGVWRTESRRAHYRALRRETLGGMLEDAGLCDVHWILPAESGFFQPLVTARIRT